MFTLDDKTIRKSLIARLSRLTSSPRAILEELRVHNGNAIADVVTVHTYAHCYEIKGETDSIHRILRQSRYYDLAFKKTTLVTTERQIEKAQRLAPSHWGIISARERSGEVRFSYLRPAKPSPAFDKRLALLTLWKAELLHVAATTTPLAKKLAQLNRAQLSELIANNLGNAKIVENIGTQLILRKS